MDKKTICNIKILNKSFEIKCPEEEKQNLYLALEKLNEHIQQKSKTNQPLDDFQNLLLAALHVSHELIISQLQQQKQREQLTTFISTLEDKITQVTS